MGKQQQKPETLGAWAPPTGAQQIELAEFFKFATAGETVIGRIQRLTSRPDPKNADKTMRALVLSPAVVHRPGAAKPEAYKTLALGFSAHLSILMGDPEHELGSAYAFSYAGTKKIQGQPTPSHQFNLYKLSEAQFAAEVKRAAGKHADALLAGEVATPKAPDDGDDDLPF